MGAGNGVVVVAYGPNAVHQAEHCISDLRRWHDWPVMAIAGTEVKGADHIIRFGDPGWGARWAKLNVNLLAPWDRFLYLDADTRPRGDLSAGFDILDDSWDLAITASEHQEKDWLWQAGEAERALTQVDIPRALSLQGGVFYCTKNERTGAFFSAFREEWQRFRGVDQAALIRALHRAPVKVWLLGRPWNGGELVAHDFGKARVN